MPHFPGHWFLKEEAENENKLFEALMLVLLKPWRSLSDIICGHTTFRDTYQEFHDHTSQYTQDRIKNIKFFHECSQSAQEHEAEIISDNNNMHGKQVIDETDDDLLLPGSPVEEDMEDLHNLITEEDIQQVLDRPFTAQELLHANLAIDIGFNSRALTDHKYSTAIQKKAHPATREELEQCDIWEKSLNCLPATEDDNNDMNPLSDASATLGTIGLLSPTIPNESTAALVPINHDEPSLMMLNLNRKQKLVYNIVINHLEAFLRNKTPPQCLMIVHGQGGTGKSALLNAIMKSFADRNCSSLLLRHGRDVRLT